jgi:hypothetical protein
VVVADVVVSSTVGEMMGSLLGKLFLCCILASGSDIVITVASACNAAITGESGHVFGVANYYRCVGGDRRD